MTGQITCAIAKTRSGSESWVIASRISSCCSGVVSVADSSTGRFLLGSMMEGLLAMLNSASTMKAARDTTLSPESIPDTMATQSPETGPNWTFRNSNRPGSVSTYATLASPLIRIACRGTTTAPCSLGGSVANPNSDVGTKAIPHSGHAPASSRIM